MAHNDPKEGQPLGSEDPTRIGPAPDDPNATQAEADEPVVMPVPSEPGTEAEGVEEATSELTQEAPLLEEIPEAAAEVPQVPAFPLDVKPKSDIYTLMLILSFITFVTVAILAGKEAYDHYDVQFYVFGKENTLTRKPAEGEEAPPTPEPAPAPGGGN